MLSVMPLSKFTPHSFHTYDNLTSAALITEKKPFNDLCS